MTEPGPATPRSGARAGEVSAKDVVQPDDDDDQGKIDIDRLAERVYRLMRDDVRLERARRGWD